MLRSFIMRMYWRGLFDATYLRNNCVILDMVKLLVGARGLDYGCSDGSFTREVAELIQASSVYGVELYEQRVLATQNKGVIVYPADLNQGLEMFEDSILDLVIVN